MTQCKAELGQFLGEKAVYLTAGAYEAILLPEWGANMVAFRDKEKGYHILREPTELDLHKFKAKPFVHGIPVLFPPNRFEDGKFPWKGKTYQFPVNEEDRGNHLHGFLHNIPWEVEAYGVMGGESYVSAAVTIDKSHDAYQYFPHEFTFRLKYTLGADGLSQQLYVKNNGQDEMPCLVAFHTAINAPFAPGSTSEDCAVKLNIGKRWEMNERMLPTGKFQELTAEEVQLRDTGLFPFYDFMDNHYTAQPVNGRNVMELTDRKAGVTLVYDVGTSYKMWMIWNNFLDGKGFFCPEPQVNLVNAPNMDLPAEEMGLFSLKSGEIWEETARIYIKA